MIDRCGRNIDYLRVSVTDRCNLRCIYCMPKEGVELVPREMILQEPEIVRVCRVMAKLGICKIKLTGGEPLVRAGMPSMVEKLKEIPGIEKVTLTTNGVLLPEQMQALAKAGLDGLNISLDCVEQECYKRIARRDYLKETFAGIQAALAFPEVALKINCVPLGIPEQDLCSVADLARENPIHVRFIEMMPLGSGKKFRGMAEQEVTRILEARFGTLLPYEGERLGNGPCHYYTAPDFQGKIGFISAVSHKFCKECNRIRLTSQGFLKTCLQYTAGRDLRRIVRGGGTDLELEQAISEALAEKPDGHAFVHRGAAAEGGAPLEKVKEDKTEKLCMSQIGG